MIIVSKTLYITNSTFEGLKLDTVKAKIIKELNNFNTSLDFIHMNGSLIGLLS